MEGKKVLHMDRNDYYGADSASLNLTQVGSHIVAEPLHEVLKARISALPKVPTIPGAPAGTGTR